MFFVPLPVLSACKAVVAAGAVCYPGLGNYTECCFTALRTGQFKPGTASKLHIGSIGALKEVQEARVEMIALSEAVARKAVEALKR